MEKLATAHRPALLSALSQRFRLFGSRLKMLQMHRASVSNRVTAWRKCCSERFVHTNTGVHNGKKNDCEEDCA